MAFDINSLSSAGLKLGNYDQKTDSATLYQPGNGYNAQGTRTVSGISSLGIDTSKLGALDSSAFSSGRSLGNMNASELAGHVAAYAGGATNDAASKAMDAANATTNAAGGTGQAPQDAYGAQLQAALKSGTQPGQLAPGVANPYAGAGGSALNTASPPGTTSPVSSPYQTGHAAAVSAGVIAPTSGGAASGVVSQYVQPPQDNSQADTVVAANQAHQQYLNDFAASQSSANQQQTLTQQYQALSQQLGLPALDTQLLNMKTVMDGTEQDIRNEITKAGGFATDSQVLALTNARNKTMIQNYNNLLQTRTDMQNNLTTMTGLAAQDRAYASAQIDKQLNFDQQQSTYADQMLKNAQDSLKTTAAASGWDAVLQSALATGDPQAVARINSTMWPGFDLATMAKTNNVDQQIKEATLAHTVAETKQINANMGIKSGGGGIGTTTPITTASGSTSYVPTNLAPYYNVSNSGVEYIDASSLQGTASQKTALVNEASRMGYKVITNKNTAADLVNIKDANGKLDSISTIMAGIGQPGWVSRMAGGLGLTWLETATQSDPQKAAAGALQAVGLDILKAISGVQGFRGNQSAVQQVTDHLPKITDTVDTINQKISYIKTLISDREDAAVGKPTINIAPASQVPAGYYQASDGLFYKK